VSRSSRQCGILNISQPYRPPQPVAGIALLQFYHIIYRYVLQAVYIFQVFRRKFSKLLFVAFSAISPQLSPLLLPATISLSNTAQTERLINSGPFGYRFKVDNTADVENADEHCFGLLISYLCLLGLRIHRKLFLTSV
jgi:hypothetical protein